MEQLQFTIPEILSLFGVVQCVYILVYMLFRAGHILRAGLPALYFLVLGCAFFMDFAKAYIGDVTSFYGLLQWFSWFSGPPLSVLLIIQIAQINKLPSLHNYWVLVLLPAALASSVFMTAQYSSCETLKGCDALRDWLIITGFIAGCVSLLAIWLKRGIFADVLQQKTGKERYWLILSVVGANIFFLFLMLTSLSTAISAEETLLVRTILGLGLVYLVNTSLFRIYPQAVQVIEKNPQEVVLSHDEVRLALRIEELMDREKVYQEASYSRSDLAQELEQPETTVSKVINLYFGKTFPQIVNERRVADAKRLLDQTGASIKTVAEEVGFNSLPSFNRVFKEVEGVTPSAYRKRAK